MANDEDVARLRQGAAVWNVWRTENPERCIDLRGANLAGANLAGANLREADLAGANLDGADLRQANLDGANLDGATLRGATLRVANLDGATLRGANLDGADLMVANLRGANLRGANLAGASLFAANLDGATGANLTGTDLGGTTRVVHTMAGRETMDLGTTRAMGLGTTRVVHTMAGRTLTGTDLGGETGLTKIGATAGLPVHFTVYHPKEIKPEVWCPLLAYMHILEMQSTVEADAKQRLEVPYGRRIGKATRGIARGAEIVVIPELPGCWFNPASARFLWLEDWHRVEFRLQAQPDLADFELGKAVNGRVAFYVESVLVGEVPIWTCISDEADTTAADAPASPASAEPYEAIFVSYAHEDSAVADRLGRAYKVLGMKFLRDVETLRSGEQWNPALLAMIDRADIFQLYWSHTAKRSRYVKQEWRHALKQERSHFIRPLYWQVPMPQPPRDLAQLHFSYLELDN